MKFLRPLFLSLLMVSQAIAVMAETPAPKNWTETLHDALTLNNKPRAKDAFLDAQKDLTKAARDGMLPTVTLNASFTDPRTDITTNAIGSSSDSKVRDFNVSLNWNLFQCGMQYYVYKAAEVNEKIWADQFESTQFFISNTKGSVVASSFQAYSSLIRVNDVLTVFPMAMKYMDILKPIAMTDGDAAANWSINQRQTQNSLTTLGQSKNSAIDVFTHWVTIAPADNINNLQQAIDELIIPATWDIAYQTALIQSPDVRQAADQIRLAEYQIKIAQAALCPQVNLSASFDRSLTNDHILQANASENDRSIGVSVSVPLFNLPNYDTINYQKKMLISDRLAQQATLDDTRFSLQQTYKDLEFQLRNQRDTESNIKEMMANILASENDIANHVHLPDPNTSGAVNTYINGKLQILGNLTSAWSQLANYKVQILQDKFSILQAMGTLFNGDTAIAREAAARGVVP